MRAQTVVLAAVSQALLSSAAPWGSWSAHPYGPQATQTVQQVATESDISTVEQVQTVVTGTKVATTVVAVTAVAGETGAVVPSIAIPDGSSIAYIPAASSVAAVAYSSKASSARASSAQASSPKASIPAAGQTTAASAASSTHAGVPDSGLTATNVPHYSATASVSKSAQPSATGGYSGGAGDTGSGQVFMHNKCKKSLWYWSVGAGQNNGPFELAAGASSKGEPFRVGGVSFKVSETNQLEGGKQFQFEYTNDQAQSQMYYDNSLVDCATLISGTFLNNETAGQQTYGESATNKTSDAKFDISNCPAYSEGVSITSEETTCGKLIATGGKYLPTQAYYVDTPLIKLGYEEPVAGCPKNMLSMNLDFTLCSDNA